MISTNEGIQFDTIQHDLSSKQSRNRTKLPQSHNIHPHTHQKTTANNTFNGERLSAFSIRSGRREDSLTSPLLYNIVLVSSIIR